MAQQTVAKEDFEALLMDSFIDNEPLEGSVVKGTVVAIEKDLAIIDVGLKTEGRIALKEFGQAGRDGSIEVGSVVEVYVDRVENAAGEAVLSREKARREEAWVKLEALHTANERVEGIIFNQVKGGFTVDLEGAIAFLPRSQVDIRPIRDIAPLMNVPQPFQILKMDKRRGNIVVSRRAILEESRAEQRSEIVQQLEEGQVVDGVVKNITDYGAFVDLGGIDGLLHVTDIAWRRVNHPTEVLTIGETIKVQIVRINHDSHRISLGMKQLQADPWEGIEAKYPVEAKFTGRVTNITDYGAFVELEPGIEGLIHVSEMSWTKKNVHPGKIVSTSQEVEVVVLEVDPDKRRISLGLKQTLANPWESFAEKFPVGAVIEGEVKNKTEFGLFIGLDGDVDGMVHLSDIDWQKAGEIALDDYNRGDMVQAKVLDVDVEKERISLGIKQLSTGEIADASGDVGGIKKGSVVTGTVTEVNDGGIEVRIADSEMTAFIRRADLSRDRNDQRPERFSKGEKVDARITQYDRKTQRISLSIKALEIAEEKEAVANYGSSTSGASLGDILGAALKDRDKE
ncbi:30S ribosomal protein S1 [Devosia algicola]|uniref:30S ribosomal protein S1 n=1 Tax=Devosia algicola TaxID=3026418 RepID=A0ABY7YKY7_9HYPH|nr:30S ribosomal protein S1 [Devosia algicola]WDR01973.1 30S ribosomal protein S1 [Devosia algicola]